VRFKVVPPAPDSLAALEAVHGAVPLVPDDEESCCARLVADAAVPSQDEAREWLTFLRALGLAEEGQRGFSRVRTDADRETLAAAFRENVYVAAEALEVLAAADDPVAAETVFERLRDRVPAWERQRDAEWREVWSERVERVLDWAVVFGLAERADGGYVAAAGRPA
jgi:hypothetical protein